MRIGVISVHDSNNYGAYLQAYAMQHILKSMGHHVYFIRSRDKKYVKSIFYSKRLFISGLLKPPIVGIKRYFAGIKKYHVFKQSWDCFQVVESDVITANNQDTRFIFGQLDHIILGSDEIWNVTAPAFQRKIFYGIGMNNVSTYAVSMGTATFNDLNKYPYIIEAIKQMDHILVRDISTKQIVKQITKKEPKLVCDPTILVDKEIFECQYHNSYLENNQYLLIYTYGINKEIKKRIIKFAREKNLKVVSAGFYFNWCDYNVMCSPLEFCQVIKNAEYVVTTSFHGSIFSILYHKQFVAITARQKIIDIITRLGLKKSMLSENCTDEELKEALTRNNFAYHIVDNEIENMKKDSYRELLESLEGGK